MSLRFEWDPKKADTNLAKHGISFDEAVSVFGDPLARIFNDEAHSVDERREIIVGHSIQQNLLLVSFTGNDVVRLISARKVTTRERKDYEENVEAQEGK